MLKARVRGTELFFDVLGAGIEFGATEPIEKPVIFLLHGGPGFDHSSFKTYRRMHLTPLTTICCV